MASGGGRLFGGMKGLLAPMVGVDWLKVLPVFEATGRRYLRCHQLPYPRRCLDGVKKDVEQRHVASTGCTGTEDHGDYCSADQEPAGPTPDWLGDQHAHRLEFSLTPDFTLEATLESVFCPEGEGQSDDKGCKVCDKSQTIRPQDSPETFPVCREAWDVYEGQEPCARCYHCACDGPGYELLRVRLSLHHGAIIDSCEEP